MKRLSIATLILCFLAALPLIALPGTEMYPGDGFATGNTFYAAGDFAKAVDAYEGQVSRGKYSANLFYNLADAYYRQNDRGRAILNYERALILDPAHAEAAANLAFVRGQKPTASTPATGLAETLPWLTASAGWLAAAGLAAFALRSRWRTFGLTLFVAGSIFCVAGIVAVHSLDDNAHDPARAVVVADNAPALYAPADNSKVIITLTAGGEVRVLSDQGAWIYVLLTDGTRAWVASNKLERVVPRYSVS